MTHTFRVPDMRCPECKVQLGAATAMQHDARPKPGDLSVCIVCAATLRFDEAMGVRALSLTELAALPIGVIEELQKHVMAVRSLP